MLDVLGQASKAAIQLTVPFVPIVSARFGVKLTLETQRAEVFCEGSNRFQQRFVLSGSDVEKWSLIVISTLDDAERVT